MFPTAESHFNSVKNGKTFCGSFQMNGTTSLELTAPLTIMCWILPNESQILRLARVVMASRKAFLLFFTRVFLSASCFSSISDADLSLTDLSSSIDFPQVKTQNSPRFSCRLRSAVRRVAWMFDV